MYCENWRVEPEQFKKSRALLLFIPELLDFPIHTRKFMTALVVSHLPFSAVQVI